jgi:hypothetical protein
MTGLQRQDFKDRTARTEQAGTGQTGRIGHVKQDKRRQAESGQAE